MLCVEIEIGRAVVAVDTTAGAVVVTGSINTFIIGRTGRVVATGLVKFPPGRVLWSESPTGAVCARTRDYTLRFCASYTTTKLYFQGRRCVDTNRMNICMKTAIKAIVLAFHLEGLIGVLSADKTFFCHLIT